MTQEQGVREQVASRATIHMSEPIIWLNEPEQIITDDNKLVTLVRDWDDSGDPAVFLSNLATAAPDLADVLRQLVAEADETGGHTRTVSRLAVDRARAALAKAGVES